VKISARVRVDGTLVITDAFDWSRGAIIEAKGSRRAYVMRTALGQLLHYSYLWKRIPERRRPVIQPSLEALFPVKPGSDLVELFVAHDITVVWEARRGQFASSTE
jgi:hypothetical protein